MFVVGLTGGIGSGKSTVANLFAELGVRIIDADVIAREVTQPKQPGLLAIVNHFGESILLPDGSLDRKQLRHFIFSNTEHRLWLENLLHPLIRDEIKRQVYATRSPYCITVIPLLLEVTPYDFIDRVLVVDASPASQIARVSERDKSEIAQVEAIIKTQIERDVRLAKAHDVIHNEGPIEELKPIVLALHHRYLRLAEAKLGGK